MPNLDAEFLIAEASITETDEALRKFSQQRKDRDRSFIAWMVIGTFTAVTAILAFYVIAGDWEAREKPAEFLLRMLSSVLLPVVTLVIGYYFGKDQSTAK